LAQIKFSVPAEAQIELLVSWCSKKNFWRGGVKMLRSSVHHNLWHEWTPECSSGVDMN